MVRQSTRIAKTTRFGISKKKGSYSIAGNERTVRLLGVNLLHRTELAGSLFSEQMLIRATHIVDIIERNYKPMRPSHKNRIINYVLIALLRIKVLENYLEE